MQVTPHKQVGTRSQQVLILDSMSQVLGLQIAPDSTGSWTARPTGASEPRPRSSWAADCTPA